MTTAVVNDFIQECSPLRIKTNADCHDRLNVLDYGLSTEQVYYCGASSRDAGREALCNKCDIRNKYDSPVIDKLLLARINRYSHFCALCL